MGKKYVLILSDTVLSDVRTIEECGQFLSLAVVTKGDSIKVGFTPKGETPFTYDKQEAVDLLTTLLKADLGSDFDQVKCHIRVCEYGDFVKYSTKKILKKYYPDVYKIMVAVTSLTTKRKRKARVGDKRIQSTTQKACVQTPSEEAPSKE